MKQHIIDFLKFLESKGETRVPIKVKFLHPDKFTITKEDLYIEGDLNLAHTKIKSLPDNLTVGGSLMLVGSKIESIPNNLKVGRDLYLADTNIRSLPDNLTVPLYLFIQDTKIESIPNNLKVGENIYVAGTPLAKRMTREEIKQEIEQKGGYVKLVDKVWRF